MKLVVKILFIELFLLIILMGLLVNQYDNDNKILKENFDYEVRKSDAIGYARGWTDGFNAAINNPDNPYGKIKPQRKELK